MSENTKKTKELYLAILGLKNLSEAQAFFRDLLTKKEIEDITNRWLAAKMLNSQLPYSLIEKETGLSSTTISRISKWLKNGRGGYRLVLNELHRH